MTEQRKTVEEVVKALGVTPRTLHYYEEMGLIPACERTAGGHRLYDEETIEKLEHILRLKEYLGYSLQEIRSVLDAEAELLRLKVSYHSSDDDAQRQEVLAEYAQVLANILATIDDKMARLTVMRTSFAERMERVRELQSDH